jgi:hypothetical protein
MKAGQLVSGANSGPEVLRVVCQAFDDAWTEIAPSVTNTPLAIEAARLNLANVVLSLAKQDSSDPELIKTEAVRQLRLRVRYWTNHEKGRLRRV